MAQRKHRVSVQAALLMRHWTQKDAARRLTCIHHDCEQPITSVDFERNCCPHCGGYQDPFTDEFPDA